MTAAFLDRLDEPLHHVRVDTLVRLRWLAVFGQLASVLVVHDGFDFEFEFWRCLLVIALYAALNVALRLRFRGNQRLEPRLAAGLLAVDIAEIALLLYFTGGLQNPFAFLVIGPVLIAATSLPPRRTLLLAGLAIGCATVLVFEHYPFPWPGEDLVLPRIYMIGVWLSILLSIGYISIYARQVTEESRKLTAALAATELVLTREQHLTQLDGLAAAAAHELGTPLSTILLAAKELERAIEPSSPHAEDVRLLREQAQRCRVILSKLTELPAPGEPFEIMKLSALIEDVVAPHRTVGIKIDVVVPFGDPAEPVGVRNPAILYGIGNLVENGVDFARERVEVAASWDDETVTIVISDDGPGFSPEIMGRMGEPYVTGRRTRRMQEEDDTPGLGLGFFIAKTLLERSGATLTFQNRTFPQRGAIVRLRWRRTDFEQRPPAVTNDLKTAAS